MNRASAALVFTVGFTIGLTSLTGCSQPAADDEYNPYEVHVLPASQPWGLRAVVDAPALELQEELCSDDGWCRFPSAAPVTRITAGLALASETWFVGGDEALVRWDGTKLSGIPLDNGPFMRTIAGSEDDFFVAGGRSTVYHYDGEGLRQIAEDTGFWSYLISDAYSPEPGKLWAVARDEVDVGVVIEFDGQEWGVHLYEQPAGLAGIDGRSSDDLWVVGDLGVIWHRAADGWEFINSGTETNLSCVLVTDDDVWIGGWGGLVLRYDDEGVHEVPSEALGTVTDLWLDAEGTLWAATAESVLRLEDGAFVNVYVDDQRLFHRGLVDAAGTNIILDEGPVPLVASGPSTLAPFLPVSSVDFYDVMDTPDGLVASGGRGMAWRHDGRAWSSLDLGDALVDDPDVSLRAVAERDGTLYFAGDRGTLLSGVDGAFTKEDSGLTADIRSLCFDQGGNLWMAGSDGAVAQRLPTGEVLAVTGAWTGDLHVVFCDDDGSVWVGGDTGVFHSQGASFVPADFDFGQRVLGLARVGDSLWAVGQLGTAAVRDAEGVWTSQSAPTNDALHAVVGQGDEVVAVGRAGTVVRYGAEGKLIEQTGLRSNLHAAIAVDGAVLAVGDDGVAIVSEP